MMRFARQILAALFVVALAAYALDCGAAMTPEQAMQCCQSTPCSSQAHHEQDCCKTMPGMHAPFVPPSSLPGVSSSYAVVAVLPAADTSANFDSLSRTIAAHSHAPPVFYSPVPLSLRI
jgi:hypothetical protein